MQFRYATGNFQQWNRPSPPPSLFLCRFFFSIFFQHCTRFPAFRKWLHFSYFLPAPAAEGGFQCQVCSAPIFSASFSFFFYLRNLWWYRISRNKKRGEGRNLPPRHSLGKIPLFLLKDVLVRTPFSRKRKRASASAAASTSPHTLCQTRRVKKKKNKMEGGASPVDVVLRGCSRLGKPLLKTRR